MSNPIGTHTFGHPVCITSAVPETPNLDTLYIKNYFRIYNYSFEY